MKPALSPRVALLLIYLGLGLFQRLLADGFPLSTQNAGTWGQSPAALVADIEAALKKSGFLDAVKVAGDVANQIGGGKVPMIDDLAGVVEGDVQARVQAAVAQANEATRLIARLDVSALQQLLENLESTLTTPQEFAVSIPGGRLVFRRNLADLSLCAIIAGPGGARVTLGISNGFQLGGNPAERFVNPTREPVLFADLALDYSHLQARRPLRFLPPIPAAIPPLSIQAATYFKIHDDWVQLRFAGSDPESLKLKLAFVVGARLGFSVEIKAEVEGQLLIELEVQPHQVAMMLGKINEILRTGLGSNNPASLKADPAAVAGVLKQVFAYMQSVRDSGEKLGELSISMATDAGLGVGVSATGINIASVGAQFKIGLPLEAVVGIQGDLLAAQLNVGMTLARQLEMQFVTMSEGRLDRDESERQAALFQRTAQELISNLLAAYPKHIQALSINYEAGIYGLGDIGQVADQTIPILVMTVDIPIGKMFTNVVNGGAESFVTGVAQTAKAAAWLAQAALSSGQDGPIPLSLGDIIRPGGIITPPTRIPDFFQRPRGNPPIPPTTAQWEAMATNLLDDFTASFRFGALGIEGVSVGGLVRLWAGASEVAGSLFYGATRAAIDFNEKPLLDALRAAPGQVKAESLELLIFNLQKLGVFYDNSLGASGSVGAGLVLGLGGRIAFDARFKGSLLLLTLANKHYAEQDGTLLAGINIPLEVSASAGVGMNEAAELTVEGGFTAGGSLANLTLKDWGAELPVPAGLRIAGFELIDFVGTNRQDGIMEGRGWLVLPQGGLVRADHFIRDRAGRVLDGTWSGVLELGPFGEVVITTGTITDQGLVGRTDLALGPSTLKADFLLRSEGLLLGTATGNLHLGGFALADVRLSLTPDGSFSGTANSQIAGATSRGALRVNLLGGPSARLTSTNDLGGVTARLDLLLNASGAMGTATVDIFGRPVVFQVAIEPGRPLTAATFARLNTPWGLALDADLKLDATGVHGSGRTRILGSEFTSDNLRLLNNGRLTGSFRGTLAVDGQQLALQALEIRDDRLEGRTTLRVAEHQGLELLLTVEAGGVFGTFVDDLSLFGAGTANARVRINDRIEVFGEMDGDFLRRFETLLRDGVLAGIEDARATLGREQQQLADYREQLQQMDADLETLKQRIRAEQQEAKAAAEAAVKEADEDLQFANQELNKAIEAVRKASGALAAELDKAEAAFRVANDALAIAQEGVNRARGEVAQLDRWYAGQNAVAKALFWAPYQINRGIRLGVVSAAEGLLVGARNARNAAESTLRGIQRQLADADALIAARDLKDAALAAARAKADEARRDLTRVLETLADPTLDIRYIALSLARESLLRLISGAEKLIAGTNQLLAGATGLIQYIDRNGPSAVVKIEKVNFRSTLADLNHGFTELIVDAVVAGQPRRFVISHHLGTGQDAVEIAAAVRKLSPQLLPVTSWNVAPWTNDASSGISPRHTLWAYRFNSPDSTRVSSVPVIGLTGTSPAVAGRFSVQGFVGTFAGDQNLLTSGTGGSSLMAADFIYGAYNGIVTFEGLTPGISYRATFLSAGFDDAPFARRVTFGSPVGDRTIDQNAYGNNHGIRIDHTFAATAATHTLTLTPAQDATFHLYALALSVEGNIPMGYSDWKQSEFGARSFDRGVGAEQDDPDGDGIPNFLEYALRLNPRSAGVSGFSLPVPVVLPGSVQGRKFTFPYQANSGDLAYRIRQSSDLVTWRDVYRFDAATGVSTQLPGVSSGIDADTQTVTVTLTDMSLFAPPSFWCLVVDKR
jgi:hypothetical protein